MFRIHDRTLSIAITLAIVLHVLWAICAWIDITATNATALYAVYQWVHPAPVLITVLLMASLFAVIGIIVDFPLIILLLIPQQVLLYFSAAGAIKAMYLAQFADGVIRTHVFLISDQIYPVLLAIGHTLALVTRARELLSNGRR